MDENGLSQSETLAALEAGEIGVWDWDLTTGQMRWSGQMFRNIGLDAGNIENSYARLLAAIHETEREAVARAFAGFAERAGPLRVEARLARPGEPHWVVFLGKTEADKKGVPVRAHGITIDSTRRRKAEEAGAAALTESEARLREVNERLRVLAERRNRQLGASRAQMQAIFDNSPDWLTLFRAMPDGRFVYVDLNLATERAYGRGYDEVVGRTVEEILGVEQAQLPLSLMRECIRTGENQRYRARRTLAGETRSIDVMFVRVPEQLNGDYHIMATARDVTEHDAVEERLRQERLLFELIIENTSEGIVVVDEALRHLIWNTAMERINGHPRGDVLGRTVFEVFPGFVDHPVGRAWRAALAGQRAEMRDYHFFSTRRGVEIVYDADFMPLYGKDGSNIGAICILRETTERRRLEHLAKLETVAQLTGGVAHDFNNLLTAAMGCLDMIRRDGTDARVTRLAGTALRSIDRGAQLTQQLLSFARRQALRPVAANLNDLLREIEVLVRRAMGETIAVVIDAAPELPICAVDPAQFEAAIMNLVMNARDAMPRGGRLMLTTRWLQAADLPADVALPAGDYVTLAVEDTGSGMRPEVMEQALEPFYTTKGIGKGSGLGLSMVYGFAKQSGGDLRIQSSVDQGTSVTLYFPVGGEPINEPTGSSGEEEQRGSGTILIVEDDDAVREVSVEIIQGLGYEALVARNGGEALEVLRHDATIDLLFTDLVMPGDLTGVMLAREAQKLRPGLPVLLATGYAGLDDPGSAEFPVIAKPFRAVELSRVVARLIDEARSA
ncbi:MAG TPA: PAS domain-containing protein [Stellaceae bacterium]|nr:PAS domain-containing protein [Stellaceae bacterium]